MKRALLTVCAAILLAGVTTTRAIDRDAAMIDSATLEVASFSDGSSLGLLLWGENAVSAVPARWAVVAGIGGGRIWMDESDDPRLLDLSLGAKYYPWKLTGLSLYGTYTMTEWGRGPDSAAGTVELKQRFITADDPISPYLRGQVKATSYDLQRGALSAGVDFMMRDDFAMVFEGGYFADDDAEALDGFRYGWFGGVSMKYYWK